MADQSPKVPTMLHFGELDEHIPMSDVETIKSKQPSVEVYTYNAGHGFQCDNAIALPPKQLKSLGAAPCASSTAICEMIVSDNVTELTPNDVLAWCGESGFWLIDERQLCHAANADAWGEP